MWNIQLLGLRFALAFRHITKEQANFLSVLCCIGLLLSSPHPSLAQTAVSDDRLQQLVELPSALTAAAQSLTRFYRRLTDLEQGKDSKPLIILQIGDSHTANDRMSGEIRRLFQERFGIAGRGTLPPGEPFEYFRPSQVKVTQEGEWQVTNSFASDATGPFGFSGFRLQASNKSARLTLLATEQPFQRIEVEYWRDPAGGDIELLVDGRSLDRFATRGSPGPGFFTFNMNRPGTLLELRPAGNGRITLLSWATAGKGSGIRYESHGIVGASFLTTEKWSPQILKQEIAFWDPALIILAYGTNEGFLDGLDLSAYRQSVGAQLRMLKSLAPKADILVLGPPDANRLAKGCLRPGESAIRFSCAPLSAREESSYRELTAVSKGRPSLCRLHPPPNLGKVREILRQAASREKLAFWDWSARMGGACAMHEWAQRDPALGHTDHVHLTRTGYELAGNLFFADLMRGYQAYHASRP